MNAHMQQVDDVVYQLIRMRYADEHQFLVSQRVTEGHETLSDIVRRLFDSPVDICAIWHALPYGITPSILTVWHDLSVRAPGDTFVQQMASRRRQIHVIRTHECYPYLREGIEVTIQEVRNRHLVELMNVYHVLTQTDVLSICTSLDVPPGLKAILVGTPTGTIDVMIMAAGVLSLLVTGYLFFSRFRRSCIGVGCVDSME